MGEDYRIRKCRKEEVEGGRVFCHSTVSDWIHRKKRVGGRAWISLYKADEYGERTEWNDIVVRRITRRLQPSYVMRETNMSEFPARNWPVVNMDLQLLRLKFLHVYDFTLIKLTNQLIYSGPSCAFQFDSYTMYIDICTLETVLSEDH